MTYFFVHDYFSWFGVDQVHKSCMFLIPDEYVKEVQYYQSKNRVKSDH